MSNFGRPEERQALLDKGYVYHIDRRCWIHVNWVDVPGLPIPPKPWGITDVDITEVEALKDV